MNYAQMRDYALQLINQYSIGGRVIPSEYNSHRDMEVKVPFLINDALIYIATTYKQRYPAQAELEPYDGDGFVYPRSAWNAFKLPKDFMGMRAGGLLMPSSMRRPGEPRYVREFILQEPNYILLPKKFHRGCILDYYRYPKMLDPKPEEDAEIDAALDAQMAICFYVACHLAMDDSAFDYASLHNEFENKMSRLAPPLSTEISTVFDAYAMEIGEDY